MANQNGLFSLGLCIGLGLSAVFIQLGSAQYAAKSSSISNLDCAEAAIDSPARQLHADGLLTGI